MTKKKKKHKGFENLKKSQLKKLSAKGGKSHSPAHMRELANKRWSK